MFPLLNFFTHISKFTKFFYFSSDEEEGDNPEESKHISYKQLHLEVCKFSNVLKKRGVMKGDRVCIYMPMIPEAAYAMLACARIGAVHSVVFGGFSPESLKDRILDSD